MCSVWPSKLSAAIGRSVIRSLGKDRTSRSSSAAASSRSPLTTSSSTTTTTTTSSPSVLTPATDQQPHADRTTTTNNNREEMSLKSPMKSLVEGEHGSPTKALGGRDFAAEARHFSSLVSHAFLLRKPRGSSEHQIRQLLDRAQNLLDAMVLENQRLQAHVGCRHVPGGSPTLHHGSPTSRTTKGHNSGAVCSTGQLWIKLDELKRENEELRRQLRSGESSPLKDKAPGDLVVNDVSRSRTDNDSLRTQLGQPQKSLRDLQAQSGAVQEDLKRSKTALDVAQRAAEKSRQEFKRLEALLAGVQAELDSAKTENDMLRQRQSTSGLGMRPATPRTDSRHTENLNERCRPSNVARRYDSLESQQWVDAKEAAEESDSGLEEGDVLSALCQGLSSTYTAAQQLYNSVEYVISEIVKQPTLAVSIIHSGLVPQCPTMTVGCPLLSGDLGDLVKQRLRQTADNVNADVLVLMAKDRQNADTRASLHSLASLPAVASYLQHCALVTWQMVIQNPPMTLVADDTCFDDVKHKLWWSCDQSSARKIDKFVWPVLYDYHRGNVLVKGCVCAS